MGRYDFKPLRVHQQASQLLETPRLKARPPWYDVIGTVPPAQALVRPKPVQHHERPKQVKTKKPSKMFKPLPISYQEDKFRQQFFKDHPWELARPRVILENDGRDGQRVDWSRIRQPGRSLDGESVVQRQVWLLNNVEGMNSARAYDQARHEFYDLRHQEDVERRVAREEAEALGSYFGKSYLEIGMELEDEKYEDWKAWAIKETAALQRARSASQIGEENESVAIDPNDPETEAGIDEIGDSVPAQGQDAFGGSPVHP
ncbi:MAG: mitochondrial ribosomal small subunit component [Sclerophora amabilis]|nr:MAG: mitochondrial ribosomal small subunit component [Sclerophora amabilis]